LPRLLGRALRARGRWTFEAARRVRGGRFDLKPIGRLEPEDGDWCIAEIDEHGEAHLVELLGADDRPAWDDVAVASQFRLRRRFPAEAEREARSHREPGEAEFRGRTDFRNQLVFTIDPEDARDHDDALSLKDLGNGRVEVGIHIADVSHYVTADSALDREAVRRGTSCYLPGGVIPMLPEHLSADLCSLRPDRDRLTISLLAELDAHGELHGARFVEGVIRSRHRLHYAQVQDALDRGPHPDAEVQRSLQVLRDLTRALRKRRFAAGALALDVPEVKASVDEHGVPLRIERRPHLESHELVEEFMLLANRCVGAEGSRRESGMLFRVHEPPSPRRLAELEISLKAVGLPRAGGVLGDPARALQALLHVPLDPAHRRLLHRMVLRALARARYLEKDLGHFGLAVREYCHFTSPIRRYPDLHNHRRVREWIRSRRTEAWDPHALSVRAAECSATEQNASDAEREATKVKGLRHLETRLGDHASGIITGFLRHGFFVELDDVPVEGFVRPSLYLDDFFVLDDTGVRMAGRRSRRRFTLGDPVRVVVARVDVPGRECDLALEPPIRRKRPERRRKG
jgi:ribonuclease R